MHDIKGALAKLNKNWMAFVHRATGRLTDLNEPRIMSADRNERNNQILVTLNHLDTFLWAKENKIVFAVHLKYLLIMEEFFKDNLEDDDKAFIRITLDEIAQIKSA